MPDPDHGQQRANFVSYVLATIGAASILAASIVLCGGMTFAFIGIVLAMALFGLLHYLLWGWAFTREVEDERVAEEFRRLVEEGDDGTPDDVFNKPRW